MKYIAFIHSQLHLNSLIAYINLVNIQPEDEMVIFLKEEPDGSTLISESDICFPLKCSIYRKKEINNFLYNTFFLFEKIIYYFRLKKKNNANENFITCIYPENSIIFSKDLYLFKKKYNSNNIILVLIEEGVGSYIRDASRWNERGWENVSGIKKTIHTITSYIQSIFSSNKIIDLYSKIGFVQRYTLFSKTKDGLIPNDIYCNSFVSSINKRAENINVNVDYYNTVIINSQPLFEELNIYDDIECYEKIKKICDYNNIKLIIKPHPREKQLDRYANFEVDTENISISQEILLLKSKNKPLAIIGLFSTTLITGSIFFNIPSICLSKLICRDKLGGYNDDINNFVSVFKNVINVPERFEELNHIIGN